MRQETIMRSEIRSMTEMADLGETYLTSEELVRNVEVLRDLQPGERVYLGTDLGVDTEYSAGLNGVALCYFADGVYLGDNSEIAVKHYVEALRKAEFTIE